MENVKFSLVKFQSSYHVVANIGGSTSSYKTTNESLAESVLNLTYKVMDVADETGETPKFEVGENAFDGDYMILATIEGEEYYLNVDTKNSAYEILNFLTAIFEDDLPFLREMEGMQNDRNGKKANGRANQVS